MGFGFFGFRVLGFRVWGVGYSRRRRFRLCVGLSLSPACSNGHKAKPKNARLEKHVNICSVCVCVSAVCVCVYVHRVFV